MMRTGPYRLRFVWLIFLSALCGCSSLGPKTVATDRLVYDDQIAESWKKQMLLNIVKLRYADMPTFLDVASIISQYGIEQQVSGDVRAAWPKDLASNSAGMGGYLRYSDKPTITYTPLSGHKFTKNLLTPIPPNAIIAMIQNGWPLDKIFSICVKSINGISNYSASAPQSSHETFTKLITFWREMQAGNLVDFRVSRSNDKESLVFSIAADTISPDMAAKRDALRATLGLKPGANEFTVTFGKLPASDTEIALRTRSVLEILIEMSFLIEVPAEHVQKKFVVEFPSPGPQDTPLMRIHASPQRPPDAFVAIPYKGYWFWIDEGDFSSKRSFTLLMIFISLTETADKTAAGPLISI